MVVYKFSINQKMKSHQIISVLIIILLLNYSSSQELYDSTLTTTVNINGQPHYKINYYPGTTDSNYKGDFYPNLESNTNVKKYTFTQSCTLSSTTDFRTFTYINPSMDIADNPNNYISNINTVLVVPSGVTVTFNSPFSIPTLLIKGSVIINPSFNGIYNVGKTIIFPGGVFQSIPSSSYNHSIILNGFTSPYPAWDPLKTSSFISLGGTVTINGLNTDSMWTGTNSSFSSYGGTFLKSFPFTGSGMPVFKLSGTVASNPIERVTYSMKNYYTNLFSFTGVYARDLNFNGGGYILMRPWSKNVFIHGISKSSMVFTLGSIVSIKNSVFYDIGHTTISTLNDNVLTSNGVNFDVTSTGTNPPDRYPITLLHNKVAVNIQNNMFMPTDRYSPFQTLSNLPRSYIGVKRSFGNIIGNAFALMNDISGISLLHGTEQFTISFNAFISTYTGTLQAERTYPDIDYQNGGIITTSPYSTYEGNAFEGNFKGGAFQVIPIQSRSTVTGISTDLLLGPYSGSTQDNTNSIKTNSIWNNVVYKDHFFAGEAEFRVKYSVTLQPTLKINFYGGWFIGLGASLLLSKNIANIDMYYDSPYIANTLSINDKPYVLTDSAHTGTYNSLTIKNSIAIATYKFFSDDFTSKYLSIVDSKFSHYSSTSSFLNRYTNRLYLSNVNGTKTNSDDSITVFSPLYKYSSTPNGIGNIIISFVPNFDYFESDGQSVNVYINGIDYTSAYEPNLWKANYNPINVTTISKQIPFTTLNGLYSVLVTSKGYYGSGYSQSGPFYANTYKVDAYATNFYLGIDLTDDLTLPRRALSIYSNQWTKCGWVSGICTTAGVYSKVTPTPSSVTGSTGIIATGTDLTSMLTSYLVNDVTNSIASKVSISLPPGKYKINILSYNPSFTGTFLDPLPLFAIKIDGVLQDPYNRPISNYQTYTKYDSFYWNNVGTANQILVIEWASNNLKYQIPICGIEIFSSITTPYSIPIDTTSTGAIINDTTSSSSTTSSATLTTSFDDIDTDNINSASSLFQIQSIITCIFTFTITFFITSF